MGMAETTKDPALMTNTLGLAVAWQGRLLGERYAEGVTDSTPLLGWSAAKSVLGALFGVLVQTQGLDIRQPAGLPEWANDARRDITIDQLLRMESGLDFDEDYAGVTDATRMLYTSASMGTFAAQASAKAPPDTRWSYSSGTSNILARILYEKAGGTPEGLHRLMYEQFFDKLGVTTAVWEHDESGALVGSSYLYMSARDWLRVCLLYMNDGVWNGERILPEGWVDYSLTPTPHAPDARFGAHIWLNAAKNPEERMLPGLPADLFMFKGFQGQWIIGIPSRELMVARLGVDHDRRWDAQGVVGGLLEVLDGH
jgi:CubicO group peptidase (beta-lactamase class C family)